MTSRRIMPVHYGFFVMAPWAAAFALCGGTALAQGVTTAPPMQTETSTPVARVTQPVNADQDPLQTDSQDFLADAYQPQGIQLGSFIFNPSVDLGETYSTNIYATPHDAKDDYVTALIGRAALHSRFEQHELNALLQVEHDWYARYTANNVTNVDGDIDGRYDLGRDSNLKMSVHAFADHEPRGSNDTTQGRVPTATQGVNTDFGAQTRQGALTISGDFLIDRYSFDNVETIAGDEINNASRDRTEYRGILRGGYEFIPGYAAVLQGSANLRDYDSDRTFGENRNSKGFDIETGIGVDITRVLRGDLLVGYLEQDYDSNTLKDPSGPMVKAVFNWTPTKLTLIAPSIERSVVESTLRGASGLTRTAYSILVRHEYARNIILRGYAGYYHDEYPGIGDHTDTYDVNGQVTYAFTPEVSLTGLVGYTNRDSTVATLTYDQTITTLTLRVSF